MIKHWLLSGDTHGQNELRLGNIHRNLDNDINPEEVGVIILGDSGYNFYLNKTDIKGKKNTFNMNVYCVRGNHEERPENLGYESIYDENVAGYVYLDPVNNKIKYLKDGGEYTVGGYSALVIGGAYSVDKWYRLKRAADSGNSFSGWFKDEQLTQTEMEWISRRVEGKHFDFVLTHTCPLSFQPTDLFLRGLDQSTVDTSMEVWMEELKDQIDCTVWCFAHYHADRIQQRGVEIFFNDWDDIDNIWRRWTTDQADVEWWLEKGPDYDE